MITMNPKKIELKKWLTSKNEPNDIKYKEESYKELYDIYYGGNIDTELNDEFLIDAALDEDEPNKFSYLKDYVEKYENVNMLVDPNSNRYHCNEIYKKIINEIVINDLFLLVPYPKGSEEEYILSKETKDLFYDFCKKYSF